MTNNLRTESLRQLLIDNNLTLVENYQIIWFKPTIIFIGPIVAIIETIN